jgi:site-specific recombinase XerD
MCFSTLEIIVDFGTSPAIRSTGSPFLNTKRLGKPLTEYCFISSKKMVFSTQRINVLLKEMKERYHLKIDNFSTHTLRKTFGRKVVEMAGENAEVALIKLMELFNHSSLAITKRYLGLRQEELLETYDLLDF